MRVALCLSGMVRSLSKTSPAIKRFLIDPFQTDVFVHTYDKMGVRSTNDLPVSAAWISSALRPKAIKIEPYDEWVPRFRAERDRLYCYPGPVWPMGLAPEARWKLANVLAQVWHVHKCDLMRREAEAKGGFKYDMVVRARMDNTFCMVPSLKLSPNTVFIPEHAGYGGVCDQFAMGDSDSMSIYSDYHLHLEKAYRSRPLFPANCGAPENLLARYLVKFTKLEVKQFHFPFDIQRENEITRQSHITPEFYEKYIVTGIAA